LVIISYTTGLSFALERIGPLATITITVFYLLVLYLFALPNSPEKLFASIYSETLIKTACQHLLLLVGFDTLIYQKYYDTPSILVGHHLPGAIDDDAAVVALTLFLLPRGRPGSRLATVVEVASRFATEMPDMVREQVAVDVRKKMMW
jgi:hypothetical protein